jgi:hypothetical protein
MAVIKRVKINIGFLKLSQNIEKILPIFGEDKNIWQTDRFTFTLFMQKAIDNEKSYASDPYLSSESDKDSCSHHWD